MCASACVSTVPQGGHNVPSASALAAVPEDTVKTRTSVSKKSANALSSASDQRSAPYANDAPEFASAIASRISPLTAAVLSDLK
jgi:hypothetical protein